MNEWIYIFASGLTALTARSLLVNSPLWPSQNPNTILNFSNASTRIPHCWEVGITPLCFFKNLHQQLCLETERNPEGIFAFMRIGEKQRQCSVVFSAVSPSGPVPGTPTQGSGCLSFEQRLWASVLYLIYCVHHLARYVVRCQKSLILGFWEC